MRAHATATNLTDAEFATREHQLNALIDDWVGRECTSFDDAVRMAAGESPAGPSIWDMPTIDSKSVVSLLTQLEPVLDRRLPATLIKPGGYTSSEELKNDLVPKLKKLATTGKAKLLPPKTTRQCRRQQTLTHRFNMTDKERKGLGARLRDARDYLGLSQEEASRAVGLTRSAISLIESGQRKVDALELKKFCEVYQRPVSDFTGDIEVEASAPMPETVQILARAASKLTDADQVELLRFAEFLSAKPK